MKTYKIIKSEGNVNGWHSPKETGETTIPESHAELLNAQKDNTGIEYVLSDGLPKGIYQGQSLEEAAPKLPKVKIKKA